MTTLNSNADTYDFIIAGAGTAGCVLANRLSQNPQHRVLLVEAGGWDNSALIHLPMGIKKTTAAKMFQWPDISEPDPQLNNRRMEIPHGKVVGGGSAINYMAHTRGNPKDYDTWAEQGALGWDYASVLPYFKACESWLSGTHDARGTGGEIGAQRSHMDDPIHQAWFEAAKAQGHRVNDDYNDGSYEGFSALQYSIANGRRSYAGRDFLKPVKNRSNLTVLTQARVTRVLFEGTKAVAIEYEIDGVTHQAKSDRQIVLSLGAINTPQVLMLSGIGPRKHLAEHGIDTIADLPVGKNLEDHLGLFTLWNRKQPGTFHKSLRMDRAALNMLKAIAFRSGPSSLLPGVIVGFIKSSEAVPQPDIQIFLQLLPPAADAWFPGIKPAYQDGFAIRTQLVGQKSRGEVLLNSVMTQ